MIPTEKAPMWLPNPSKLVNWDSVSALRQQRHQSLADPKYQKLAKAVDDAKGIQSNTLDVSSSKVVIGNPNELSIHQQGIIQSSLEAFIPWKKGPFTIFGKDIDSEWRSDLKWQRLVEKIPPLIGRTIADIGCNNGYFMYRMLAHDPHCVVGFEPVARHWYNFKLLQQMHDTDRLHFELLGAEHLDFFPKQFDTIFCLGILYHHTDPISLLRKMRLALRKGGELIIDCQGIGGEEPIALVPKGRYAGASGIWFLPTFNCLVNWVRRAGFGSVDKIFSAPLSVEEQRATKWAPIKSLKDFLNDDSSATIESYPPPQRFYLRVSG